MLTHIHYLASRIAERAQLAVDCLILCAACVVASYAAEGQMNPRVSLFLSVLSVLVWLVFVRMLRHYDIQKAQGIAGEFGLTGVLVLATSLMQWLMRYLLPSLATPSHLPTYYTISLVGTLSVSAFTYFRHQRKRRKPNEILLIGAGALGYYTGLELRDEFGKKLAGFLRFADEQPHKDLPAQILGTVDELDTLLRERGFDEIYITASLLKHGEAIEKAVHVCELYGLPFALPITHFRMERARPRQKRAVKDGYLHFITYENKPVQMSLKRLFDIAVSLAVLVLVSPLFLIFSILIKVTSHGPIFFRQRRVGIFGREFNMLKFRSMVQNAEALKAALMEQNEMSGPVFKIKRDPRITAVGHIMRKFSIDELPQLLNVLRGDMAVVGPRPALPSEVARYEPWQKRRLSVRPGITCEWQVSGRNNIPFEEWMYLDMHYIDHWSLFSDFVLLLKTIPVVISGRGAS